MPKVVRNYVHEDFSSLLNELQGIPCDDVTEEGSGKRFEPSDVPVVSMAQRKRQSLIDNPKMLYAYSSFSTVMHDRSCSCVASISDENFRMTDKFDADATWCRKCYRRAIIRQGIGADQRKIGAYERFFNRMYLSTNTLFSLVIENKGALKLINLDVMQIKVREDTWQVVCGESGNELWHNNYIRLDDGTRHFVDGFHRQFVNGPDYLHNLVQVILGYSWASHIEPSTNVDNKPVEIVNDYPEIVADAQVGFIKRVLGTLCDLLKKFFWR